VRAGKVDLDSGIGGEGFVLSHLNHIT
jgi:hypothetical protein